MQTKGGVHIKVWEGRGSVNVERSRGMKRYWWRRKGEGVSKARGRVQSGKKVGCRQKKGWSGRWKGQRMCTLPPLPLGQ
eukprot:754166-Hanusia_phi.AAC.1